MPPNNAVPAVPVIVAAPVQPKFVLRSSTIWGAIIGLITTSLSVVGPVLDGLGVTVPVQPGEVEIVGKGGLAAIQGVGAIVAAAMVWYGRFKSGRNAQPVSLTVNAAPEVVKVVPAGVVKPLVPSKSG